MEEKRDEDASLEFSEKASSLTWDQSMDEQVEELRSTDGTEGKQFLRSFSSHRTDLRSLQRTKEMSSKG